MQSSTNERLHWSTGLRSFAEGEKKREYCKKQTKSSALWLQACVAACGLECCQEVIPVILNLSTTARLTQATAAQHSTPGSTRNHENHPKTSYRPRKDVIGNFTNVVSVCVIRVSQSSSRPHCALKSVCVACAARCAGVSLPPGASRSLPRPCESP